MKIGVLGATGNVGQRFIELLEDHPWFRVAELVASDRSAGKSYAEAADWRLGASMPDSVRNLTVQDYDADLQSPIAFSGLPGEVAGEIEQRLAKNGLEYQALASVLHARVGILQTAIRGS